MMRPYGRRVNSTTELVIDLIDHMSATWNMTKLEEVYLPIDIPATISILLCSTDMSNTWAWNFEKSGTFTVRSTYRMMVDTKMRHGAWLNDTAGSSSMDHDGKSWKLLWNTLAGKKTDVLMATGKISSSYTENAQRAHKYVSYDCVWSMWSCRFLAPLIT